MANEPRSALIGGVALLVAGTAATVWGERTIFAFGERRRARGARFAHALPALALATLAAASLAGDLYMHWSMNHVRSHAPAARSDSRIHQ